MLEDSRSRTLEVVDSLTEDEVDAIAPGLDNTVGATLYHVAAIEADYLYDDILRGDYPDWLRDVFPYDVREEDGRLTPVTGFTVENHVARLATVRDYFLTDIKSLEAEAFSRPGESSPEWVFYHLLQHEAEHRGQIQSILTALRP